MIRIWRRRNNQALVLGCGPAGLFAAHTLVMRGWSVDIFSKRVERSHMFGAQYLHAPIEGLAGDDKPFTIDYQLRGNVLAYKDKVYPPGPETINIEVSPQKLLGKHQAWDIRAAYYDAWDRYRPLISKAYIDGLALRQIIIRGEYGLIISSVPATSLCEDAGHRFISTDVWAVGDAPELGVNCPIVVDANTVVCNGEESPSWYRASNIRGFKTAEWPFKTKPPIPQVVGISKPVRTTCDCFPGVIRVGRYGTWSKAALAHTAQEVAAKYASR